jgi:hypothetical protein
VLRAIAGFNGRYSAEEIVVGVPDKRVVPSLEQRLFEAGIPARFVVGGSAARTGPGQLLKAVADVLQEPRYTALAAVVRHPAILEWLAVNGCNGDCLSALDRYQVEHLPAQAADEWLSGRGSSDAKAVYRTLQQLVRPLVGRPRRLSEWTSAIADLLIAVYGNRELDKEKENDKAILAACRQIRKVLEEHQLLHPSLTPVVSASQAIRLVLAELDTVAISSASTVEAIELLGWLELPLDDAPALVVTGMNEGLVPATKNGDLFLPNGLRRKLELEDNDRRYARDLYFLNLLAASRKELRIVAGRRSIDNDPLTPSRLLLACQDAELAARVRRFFGPAAARAPLQIDGRPAPGGAAHRFAIPKPRPLTAPVEALRVTEFRDYLACPYRYYLRHRLELEELTDDVCELDAGQFGSLIHDVLKQFSEGDLRDSADEWAIGEQLGFLLNELALRDFGQSPLATVRLQIEQARLRLTGFARWQAAHRRQGWRIRYAEEVIPAEKAFLLVDGTPMYLRGRIDRIDFNERSKEWLVLDYKTSDGADEPNKVHRDGDAWVDLQLPLYRHLAKALDISGRLRLGYIVLPKSVGGVECKYAEWSDDELAVADDVAADVVRGIRQQRFWPPADSFSSFDAFSIICQADQFGAQSALAGDEEDAS